MTEQDKRDRVLWFAQKEIGVCEMPSGSNRVKYNTWFYGKEVRDGAGKFYPWCGTFVSWVFHHAGFPLGVIDYRNGFAGCPYALRNVAKWGRFVLKPQPGDVVIFDWNLDKRPDHTGIFKADLSGKFLAIEGNTAVGNDSNGGQVMERERSYRTAIFIRPNAYDREIVDF